MRRGPYRFRGVEVPEELISSINAYMIDGRPTGGFLEAVIDNDLREACGRADEHNLGRVPAIVAYLYNECPMGSWGFRGAYTQWLDEKRRERELCPTE